MCVCSVWWLTFNGIECQQRDVHRLVVCGVVRSPTHDQEEYSPPCFHPRIPQVPLSAEQTAEGKWALVSDVGTHQKLDSTASAASSKK